MDLWEQMRREMAAVKSEVVVEVVGCDGAVLSAETTTDHDHSLNNPRIEPADLKTLELTDLTKPLASQLTSMNTTSYDEDDQG